MLDFGKELHGGIRITTGAAGGRVRVRFGESVSEAMSTPNQDHTIHDAELQLPFMGCLDYGSTGFRFVRIDGISETVPLLGICAIALYRDLPKIGSFKCSDERLNKIWETGLYTVQMCMQDFLYDGIKRDRLVWLGDLNPEIRVILSVFDDTSILKQSLDFMKQRTPLPNYMNGMTSYSCWWVINQWEYYLHKGDLDYLKEQADYFKTLTRQFADMIVEDRIADENCAKLFLDWPSSTNSKACMAGGQGLLVWMFKDAVLLAEALNDQETKELAQATIEKLQKFVPDCDGQKTAAAMLTLSGLKDCSDVLAAEPTKDVSTFFGYYMLLAQPVQSAIEIIRKYWGGMLDYGATTFWEDFNLDWLENTTPIDQLPVPGKKDLHADFGNFCYKGLRHSLCHGWAGGPTAYMLEKILGIRVTAPGCKKITFNPELCDLEFAEGTFPTPEGVIYVKLKKGQAPEIICPPGVEIE